MKERDMEVMDVRDETGGEKKTQSFVSTPLFPSSLPPADA